MSASPLDRLGKLAAQRTTRTDRLHASVAELLGQIENAVEVGDCARVDGYTLTRSRTRSNVGYVDGWDFASQAGDDDYGKSCDPTRPVNGEGYIHGDFHCAWRGPSREELIAFASRAKRFVEALADRHTAAVGALETAQVEALEAIEMARA